jgi:hypothetical protein
MASKPLYAYCHGFLSGPSSSKGRYLRSLLDRHGIHLHLLDLNGPDGPASLTPGGALASIEAFWASHANGSKMRLIGSSFGGWASARYAELHPDRVDRMLLLAPAFELRWHGIIGDSGVAQWRRDGVREFTMPSSGATVRIPWSFAVAVDNDLGGHPPPRLRVPTTIVHGEKDEALPIAASERAVAASQGAAELITVDDDHALVAPRALQQIAELVERRLLACPC